LSLTDLILETPVESSEITQLLLNTVTRRRRCHGYRTSLAPMSTPAIHCSAHNQPSDTSRRVIIIYHADLWINAINVWVAGKTV